MAPLDRTEKFQIRLTPEEKLWLEVVAEHDGLSASDLIRQYIRQRSAPLKEAKVAAAKSLQDAFGGAPKRQPAKKKK